MSNFFKRKAWLPLAASACIVLASSCSEDFQKWEILQGDVKCECLGDDATPLPYSGESVLMTVETNGDWRVTTPSWISADRTSGTGNAIVTLDVPENNTTKKRNGTVTVDFSASEESNLAGEMKKELSVRQESYSKVIRVEIAEAYIVRDRYYDYASNMYLYNVGYHVTYNVESDLSDPEIAGLVSGATLRLVYFKQDGAWDGNTYGWNIRMTDIKNIDLSRGKHTIEAPYWLIGSRQVSTHNNSGKVEIRCIMNGDDVLLGEGKLTQIDK